MLHTLTQRRDFTSVAAEGLRVTTRNLVIQRAACRHGETGSTGIGFTVTKKQGNAVIRNRIRRRLREAFRQHYAAHTPGGYDFVVIGRAGAADCPYDTLVQDLSYALRKLDKMDKSKA